MNALYSDLFYSFILQFFFVTPMLAILCKMIFGIFVDIEHIKTEKLKQKEIKENKENV